jgi:hypothetical protein
MEPVGMALSFKRVTSLQAAIAVMKPHNKESELFIIWGQLTKVLKTFHSARIFLCDVTKDNIVHARTASGDFWTLLEYGNASKTSGGGVPAVLIPARSASPEVRALFCNMCMHQLCLAAIELAPGTVPA